MKSLKHKYHLMIFVIVDTWATPDSDNLNNQIQVDIVDADSSLILPVFSKKFSNRQKLKK